MLDMGAPVQTEIGSLPKSWDVVKFSEDLTIKNGQVDPKRSPFREMLHVGPENIESNTGRLINLNTNEALRIGSGNYHFTTEDVLYSKIRPYLNKAALPNFEGTCSADMYPIRAKDGHYDRTFLFHLLLSEPFNKQAISFQDRTGIPKINRSQLASVLLPKPPIAEQKKIAYVLSTVQRAVEQQERSIALTTELKKALIHNLFTEGLRGEPQKETEIGPVPESWDVVPLEEVVARNIVDGVHKTPSYIQYGIPFITAKDIVNNEICFDDCKYISSEEHQRLTRRVKPETGCMSSAEVGILGGRISGEFQPQMMVLGCFGLSPYAA